MTLDSFSTLALRGESEYRRVKNGSVTQETVSNHVPNVQQPNNIGMIETLELL